MIFNIVLIRSAWISRPKNTRVHLSGGPICHWWCERVPAGLPLYLCTPSYGDGGRAFIGSTARYERHLPQKCVTGYTGWARGGSLSSPKSWVSALDS